MENLNNRRSETATHCRHCEPTSSAWQSGVVTARSAVISSERSDERSAVRAVIPHFDAVSRRSAFTLVELVIVIAIVIILSVVSVPIYRGYTKQAKWTEGYTLLGTIISSQKSYYSQYGNFLYSAHASGKGFTSNEEVLGIDARGNKYFSYFSVGNIQVLNNLKRAFYAHVVVPAELRFAQNKSLLRLSYDLDRSGGVVYSEVETEQINAN